MTRDEGNQTTDRRSAWALLALALGLSLLVALETLLRVFGYVDFRETTLVLDAEYLIGTLTTIPFLLGIGYGGVRLLRSPKYASGNRRVLAWTLSAAGVSILINVLVILVTPNVHFWYEVAWLRWAAALGAGVGVLAGFLEQRAIQNAREAERARVRAEQIESQRDMVDYLNSLLRHEVLNGINVIEGHSQMVGEKIDDQEIAERHIEPIVRRSRDIGSIISDIRILMQAIDGTSEFKAVNLHNTVNREVTKIQDMAPEAEVSVNLPDDMYVEGDDMIGRIFGNVLSNAVEHNDTDQLRVRVEGWQSDGNVVVEVIDNGSGIDGATETRLFDRPKTGPADHGLGLYLVNQLCTQYGGSIELVETGDEGTTFRITLPAASTPS